MCRKSNIVSAIKCCFNKSVNSDEYFDNAHALNFSEAFVQKYKAHFKKPHVRIVYDQVTDKLRIESYYLTYGPRPEKDCYDFSELTFAEFIVELYDYLMNRLRQHFYKINLEHINRRCDVIRNKIKNDIIDAEFTRIGIIQ